MRKYLLALTLLVPAVLVVAQYYDYNNNNNNNYNNNYDYNNNGGSNGGGVSQQDLDAAFRAAEEARRRTEQQQRKLVGQGRFVDNEPLSPDFRHQRTTATNDVSIRLDNMQRRFEEASVDLVKRKNLRPDELENVQLNSGTGQQATRECEAVFNRNCRDSRYRTFDGSCNNLQHPTWGMTNTCLRRFLPPAYADGIRAPRVMMAGGKSELPNARFISMKLHEQVPIQQTNQYTHLVMQFGQFLDHDLDLTPGSVTADSMMPNCCPWMANDIPQCFPIFLPNSDPFFSQFRQNCMNVVRSAGCPICRLGPKQQTNTLSAYIDASNVYGSSLNESQRLRDSSNTGKLATQSNKLPPPSLTPTQDSCSNLQSSSLCFRAGDTRINQQVGLVSMHTVWIGQHNRIADQLARINPRANQEQVYQEARKIVGAQMQAVVYKEFLPVVLGNEIMQRYGLSLTGFTRYDPNINAGIYNEFAAAAFRFGHSLIQDTFSEKNYDGSTQQELSLKDNFFKVLRLYQDPSELDKVLLGLILKPGKKYSPAISKDVTNHLYQTEGSSFGMDLPAINVQRGRDHGIPGYVEYVKKCMNIDIRSFSDLRRFMEPAVINVLHDLYGDPRNIDLFTGGVSEVSVPGGIVGPTFGCIIADQFRNLKNGDRYFFTHVGEVGSFNQNQIRSILSTTYAKIICENGIDLEKLPQNVFRPSSNSNPVIDCSQMPDVDIRLWR